MTIEEIFEKLDIIDKRIATIQHDLNNALHVRQTLTEILQRMNDELRSRKNKT